MNHSKVRQVKGNLYRPLAENLVFNTDLRKHEHLQVGLCLIPSLQAASNENNQHVRANQLSIVHRLYRFRLSRSRFVLVSPAGTISTIPTPAPLVPDSSFRFRPLVHPLKHQICKTELSINHLPRP
jgi:hypothetical protein